MRTSKISPIHQLKHICLDETLASSLFRNQIRKLMITIDNQHPHHDDTEINMLNLLIEIFTVFINLTELMVAEFLYRDRVRLYLNPAPSATFSSSALKKLNIKVHCFEDCLFILDGRFNQLQTFQVSLDEIFPPRRIQNEVSFLTKSLGIVKEKSPFCLE